MHTSRCNMKSHDVKCFPDGMRVLAIEDNIVCRTNLVDILEKCRYEVIATSGACEALKLLRVEDEKFDIVICNMEREDTYGFKLLEIINAEMDIPVVLVSERDDHESAMRGMKGGASAYLVKPLRVEEMKNIWQHVVRRNLTKSDKSSITAEIADHSQTLLPRPQENQDESVELEDGQHSNAPQQLDDESSTSKKPRVLWTPYLHFKFLTALQQLGEKDAVPNKILKVMNEPGLTRENIASHLQKHRNNLKKQNNSLVIASNDRRYDPEMNPNSGAETQDLVNSTTLIHSPNPSTNCMMNLMPPMPMPINQAPILQPIQYPNYVQQPRFTPMEHPVSSPGYYTAPPDFRLSRWADEIAGVPMSHAVRNGVQLYQFFSGNRQNSIHLPSASSSSETDPFYQKQYLLNSPLINLPIPTACNAHSLEEFPSFQQSQVQQGQVNSFDDDDLRALILQEFSDQEARKSL